MPPKWQEEANESILTVPLTKAPNITNMTNTDIIFRAAYFNKIKN